MSKANQQPRLEVMPKTLFPPVHVTMQMCWDCLGYSEKIMLNQLGEDE